MKGTDGVEFGDSRRIPSWRGFSQMMLHDVTSASQTVWAYWTRALSFTHFIPGEAHSPRTEQPGRMVILTELDIDEIFFPADLAFGGVLLAHLS